MSGNLPVYNIIHYLPINGWPADLRNDWYSARFTKRVHFFRQVLISDTTLKSDCFQPSVYLQLQTHCG